MVNLIYISFDVKIVFYHYNFSWIDVARIIFLSVFFSMVSEVDIFINIIIFS